MKRPFGVHFLYVRANRTTVAILYLRLRRIQTMALLISGLLYWATRAQMSDADFTGITKGRYICRLRIYWLGSVMLGRSRPFGVLGASALFGLLDVVVIELIWFKPTQFTQVVPYMAELVAMFSLEIGMSQGSNGSSITWKNHFTMNLSQASYERGCADAPD